MSLKRWRCYFFRGGTVVEFVVYTSENCRDSIKHPLLHNCCNISRFHLSSFITDLIDFFVDTTPIKQNTYTPGKHIPVLPYTDFTPHPDVAVLFAWNHKAEIMSKEKEFTGKWITHLYEEFSG